MKSARVAKENARTRQGLTLVELVVVILVLVALAGIVIPMLPNMIGRAHTSTGATNIGEVNKAVLLYEQTQQSYPNDLDNLAGTSDPIDYLPGTNAGGQITQGALTASQSTALRNAGITRLAGLYPTRTSLLAADGTITFNPYDGTTANVAAGQNVAYVSEAAVEGLTGIVRDEPGTAKTGDVYVIFGLGRRCSMIGKVISDPPTHFGENSESNAANVYSRIGLVFRVARGNGTATPTPLDRAIFVGSVSMHDDGIVGGDAHLEEYHGLTKSE